mmetsp:Transcript_23287/g.88268  ORF Transcript_23287/g.88268 Transcript_23287/m.88268 type:complete len:337 (+) Transcript_23287:760-1770(+)
MLWAREALNRVVSWLTMPSCDRRLRTRTLRTSSPPTSTLPRDTSYSRKMSLAMLLLPAPEGPTMAVDVPAGTVKLTPRSTIWPVEPPAASASPSAGTPLASATSAAAAPAAGVAAPRWRKAAPASLSAAPRGFWSAAGPPWSLPVTDRTCFPPVAPRTPYANQTSRNSTVGLLPAPAGVGEDPPVAPSASSPAAVAAACLRAAMTATATWALSMASGSSADCAWAGATSEAAAPGRATPPPDPAPAPAPPAGAAAVAAASRTSRSDFHARASRGAPGASATSGSCLRSARRLMRSVKAVLSMDQMVPRNPSGAKVWRVMVCRSTNRPMVALPVETS